MFSIGMGTRRSAAIVALVVVALIVTSAACLVHSDDDALDVCASMLTVALALTLTFSLERNHEIIFTRLNGYQAFSSDPPAPPPKI